LSLKTNRHKGMNKKILVVEDEFIEANHLEMVLTKAGYDVCSVARSVPLALDIIKEENPDFVLLDIMLKGNLTGIDLGRILMERNIPFVYISANSNKETLDAAKATEPYGFLVKPFREKDVLVTLDIAYYLHENRLKATPLKGSKVENPEIHATIAHSALTAQKSFSEYQLIGNNAAFQKVLQHLQIVAPMETSVLITGESGTGKEKIAECIHRLSQKKDKPLVKVNCAAIPVNLIESELFGHERGAFTGATERRIGKFELAKEGTIFLDEIGEMTIEMQVKLLRALQEKEIERVGSNTPIKINARVIAATNRDLEKEVSEGRFRIDLYYRLNVFPLALPPLRERREDIILLANYFIEAYARKLGRRIDGVSDRVLSAMMKYNWPGNIRELEHFIERSILLSSSNIIDNSELSIESETSMQASENGGVVKTIDENERDHILAMIKKCNGKISGEDGAAALLGIPVSTLNSRMKRLGIEKKTYFRE
jgi:two-component system, NtrC family, response regulator HydG